MSRAEHEGPDDVRPDEALGATGPDGERFAGLTVHRDEVDAGAAGGPLPRVRAVGELDAASAPGLLEALSGSIAAAASGTVLVVALDEVTFCDSRGLSVLVTATRAAARAGASLRIVAGPGAAVSRLLERTGMTGLLPLHPDVASAVAADTPSPLEDEVHSDLG